MNRTALGLASLIAVLSIGACSSGDKESEPAATQAGIGPSTNKHADLVGAVQQRLSALASAYTMGNPDAAASLSTGDQALMDQASARGFQGQRAAGDTTDHGFEVVRVQAYPLDGGATDFVAYAKTRSLSDAAVHNLVELYHRDNASAPWKTTARVNLADNIDLPQLKLDGNGNAHLLDAEEMRALNAAPADVAARYAGAMNNGGPSGKLPSGSFTPGQYTTGEIQAIGSFLNRFREHGSAEQRWEPRPGGQAVALTAGTLVFARLQQTRAVQHEGEGDKAFFVTQDRRRLAFGGLLAPGDYDDLSWTSMAVIAVVLPQQGLPDVVGRAQVNTALTGRMVE
ncbi:MAG: hypothetical protein M3396_07110 [Actinomycetota bacterium]|nr:hypothetical protein [Actinomycetota bacterium]MDQ3574408.1 hypothetical protein [Actinomycetota bacterium]